MTDSKTAALIQRYPALQRPLVFGDPEQCAALEEIERRIAAEQEIEMLAGIDYGDEHPEWSHAFAVTFEIVTTTEDIMTIYARDVKQARKVAQKILADEYDNADVVQIRAVVT